MLSFHRGLKRFMLNTFSSDETSPSAILRGLQCTMYRPCGKAEGEALRNWCNKRKIIQLVHFTPLENVPNVVRYGLIPREYLSLNVVDIVIGASFTDGQRSDGYPQYNCLSVTSPNYKMFFRKRQEMDNQWAVITFKANLLSKYYFDFSPTNAASTEVTVQGGLVGMKKLFLLSKLRKKLRLRPNQPTDPQAEVLCDTILPSKSITGVFVDNQNAVDWLHQQDIEAQIDRSYFEARQDYEFWRDTRITELPKYPE